jgi:hypothetical protein
VLRSPLVFLASLLAAAFVLITNGAAEVFSCICGNGTPCAITCQCTGAASCGYSMCSTRCGVCTQAAMRGVAASLGTALYETSYISTKQEYSSDDLVADFNDILKAAPGLKFSNEERQIGPDKNFYVLLRHKRGALNQSILFPEDYLKQTDEFLKNIQELAPEIAQSVRRRLAPFGKLLWPGYGN